jgi:mannose/cellobiose epimerase-like protein (N-acyl-D-glucosamine 2-epimerase family)
MVRVSLFLSEPYRRRTWLRRKLPFWVIDLGIADKGQDCEAAGGFHEWYSQDSETSACYHCCVTERGQLWLFGDATVRLRPPTDQL